LIESSDLRRLKAHNTQLSVSIKPGFKISVRSLALQQEASLFA